MTSSLSILRKIYWDSSHLDIGSPFQLRLIYFGGHHLSIRSIRYEFFLAFLMKGCRISSLALGRFSGSLFRQVSTNSLNCLEKLPVSWGGLFFGIRKRTLIGCRSEFGGSPCKWTWVKKKLELSSRVDCEKMNKDEKEAGIVVQRRLWDDLKPLQVLWRWYPGSKRLP